MNEYKGRINVSKDTMLFVVNDIFEQNIKENTTKENILSLMLKIYEEAEDELIIKMLPYETYKNIERLIKYLKTSEDIKAFYYKNEYKDVRYLEDAMVIVGRVKYHEYIYELNPGVLDKLKRIFSKENKLLAEKYGKIEKLTIGMLYAYGIVDFEFLRSKLSKYMNEEISEQELRDFWFTRLNLNTFVNDYNIRWMDTHELQSFVTYLDEEYLPIDIGEIAVEQKARNMTYKEFSKQEILKREEYFENENSKKLYQFIKSKNDNIYEWTFKEILKKNELGINVVGELTNICMFKDDIELERFMNLFNNWYNNSPQYMLGGYSPIEFRMYLNKK